MFWLVVNSYTLVFLYYPQKHVQYSVAMGKISSPIYFWIPLHNDMSKLNAW